MQFICESCKANLQIADEKIRGKRLIVRCKRCGVQIRIVDPALLPSQSGGNAVSSSSQSGRRPEAGPMVGPRTYLWTEGMEAWIRAKDVPELVPFFAAPPTPPPPPGDEPRPDAHERRIELPFDPASGYATPPSTERSGGGAPEAAEPASPDAPTPPGGLQLPTRAERGPISQPRPPATEKAAAADPLRGSDASAPGA